MARTSEPPPCSETFEYAKRAMKGTSQVERVRRHVLDELRTGILRPGSAISVQDEAVALRTSATLVREALERLVGEGILDVGVPTRW